MNRADLLYDLQETLRQLRESLEADEPSLSVKATPRPPVRRKLDNRLTPEQVVELVAAFEAGATRMELATRYGIGRTSVAKILREHRQARTSSTSSEG